jgi:hypothetical protein
MFLCFVCTIRKNLSLAASLLTQIPSVMVYIPFSVLLWSDGEIYGAV